MFIIACYIIVAEVCTFCSHLIGFPQCFSNIPEISYHGVHDFSFCSQCQCNLSLLLLLSGQIRTSSGESFSPRYGCFLCQV